MQRRKSSVTSNGSLSKGRPRRALYIGELESTFANKTACRTIRSAESIHAKKQSISAYGNSRANKAEHFGGESSHVNKASISIYGESYHATKAAHFCLRRKVSCE